MYRGKKSIVGKEFGHWTVIAYEGIRKDGRSKVSLWLCRCKCGTEKVVSKPGLLNGRSRSCGCMSHVWRAQKITTHGETLRGKVSREYNIWLNMKDRCYNPRSNGYPLYGGRGIKMHEPWRNSFVAFLTYVGRSPSKKHSIDRIDNDRGYEPSNVCWAISKWQVSNRRNTLRRNAYEFNGLLSFGT